MISNSTTRPRGMRTRLASESGVALMIALLVLLVTTVIAMSAIEHAGEESTLSGRLRRSVRTFHAADGGIQVALNRVAQNPPNLSAFTFSPETATSVRSGRRTDGSAQPLTRGGTSPAPEGYSINVGTGFVSRLYQARVTAASTDGATVEVEAQFTRMEAGGGY